MELTQCKKCEQPYMTFEILGVDQPCPYCNKGYDKDRGVYKKYNVERLNDPEGKHDNCEYFVLDLVHDKFAKPALLAYADACEEEYPELAAELRQMWRE